MEFWGRYEFNDEFLHFMADSKENFYKQFKKEYMKTKSLKCAYRVVVFKMIITFFIALAQYDAVLGCIFKNKFPPFNDKDKITVDDFLELDCVKDILMDSLENLVDKFK